MHLPSWGRPSTGNTCSEEQSSISSHQASYHHVQAQPAFAAAFELLPRAFSLLTGRRTSQASAGALSAGELRSLGDLFWLTGLLLLGTDCPASLSPAWAASVQQVTLQQVSLHNANC